MAAGNHEQENRTNSLTEEHVRSAIETVLGKTEQSYEDFMSCFTSLKKEDVVEHQAQQLQKMLRKDSPTEGQRSYGETNWVGGLNQMQDGSSNDEIETEDLDEGHYAPTRQATNSQAGARFVQMDNFVDDAELLEDDPDNDEEFGSCPYESSFGITNSSSASSPLKLTRELVERIKEDGGDDNKDEMGEAHLELVGGGGEMRTLPGEAEDESKDEQGVSDDAVHQTELEMSTRCPEAVAAQDHQSETSLQVSTDEVQPFALDADFDYDNVVLTPKWDSNHGPSGWKPGH